MRYWILAVVLGSYAGACIDVFGKALSGELYYGLSSELLTALIAAALSLLFFPLYITFWETFNFVEQTLIVVGLLGIPLSIFLYGYRYSRKIYLVCFGISVSLFASKIYTAFNYAMSV